MHDRLFIIDKLQRYNFFSRVKDLKKKSSMYKENEKVIIIETISLEL